MAPPDTDIQHPNPAVTQAGALIRAARKSIGLSVAESARRSDLSIGAWWSLENGYRTLGKGKITYVNPRATTWARAAQAVGLAPAYVLRVTGHDPNAVEPMGGGPPSVTERELSAMFSRLNGEQRASVLSLLRSMLASNDEESERDVDVEIINEYKTPGEPAHQAGSGS